MSNFAIEVENLGKTYQIGELENYYTLRDSLSNIVKYPFNLLSKKSKIDIKSELEFIWALKDINFQVKHGEIIGIIGRNGAGKSTLLKILSRITTPTEGRVQLNGRVGSLLEVGTGFHPELTGRENIFLNGSILGMSKKEIERKFDEIVDFAEIEKFLDTPVKRYSSGMYVRLAFAVAAHLEPEILLVDEVLAVGDIVFQKKCLGKLDDVSKDGRTILFVSHNLASIQSLCSSGIVLDKGKLLQIGSIDESINTYIAETKLHIGTNLQNRSIVDDISIKSAWFEDINFSDKSGKKAYSAITGQPLNIHLHYDSSKDDNKLTFNIGIYNILREKLLHLSTSYTNLNSCNFPKKGEIVFMLPKLQLPEGTYIINLSLFSNNDRQDHIIDAIELDVSHGDYYGNGQYPQTSQNKFLIDYECKIQ